MSDLDDLLKTVRSARLFDLAGRNALVMGGGTGLGQAMALALAGAGADVASPASGNGHVLPVDGGWLGA